MFGPSTDAPCAVNSKFPSWWQKLVTVCFEVELDPGYVMFGGVGMGYSFAQGNGNVEHFICGDFVRAFDDGHMFFLLSNLPFDTGRQFYSCFPP